MIIQRKRQMMLEKIKKIGSYVLLVITGISAGVIFGYIFTGCALLDQITEPNTVGPVQQGVAAAGIIATAAGMPWGWICTTVVGVIGTAAASYRNWRNNTKNADKYTAIELTTAAIIDAIETTAEISTNNGKTVGETVKDAVKRNLSDKDWYNVGKAIITGIKNR
jgi:hypothetical protein